MKINKIDLIEKTSGRRCHPRGCHKFTMVAAVLFAAQILFAQETAPPESVPEAVAEETAPVAEPAPVPEPVAELPDTAKVVAGVADNSIPANIPKESGSGGWLLKPATQASLCLAAAGLGAVIYGVVKDGYVARYVKKRDGKAAVDAEGSRNMSYGIGASLLAGGLIVYLVF